jgi:hypothetical protein
MEMITIFDLNAMYGSVHHKLTGVAVNGVPISWCQWLEGSARYDVDHMILYFLDPLSKAIHITFPEFEILIYEL